MNVDLQDLRHLYGRLRRLPLVGRLVTSIVRATKLVRRVGSRFDRDRDELHLVSAIVQDLRAEVDRLGREVIALRAARLDLEPLRGLPAQTITEVAGAMPAATAVLAREGAAPAEEIALDLHADDRSDLIARLKAYAPAELCAATIPLSGSETPEMLRNMAHMLARAMRGRAILCLRLLDRLSLFLIGPRMPAASGDGPQVSPRASPQVSPQVSPQMSPEVVIELFELHGCRLVGLRRGTTGALPTLDLILEMREL
ncbi:hypothetical protein ACFQU1_02305 [Chelatococcus sp. GCM10030263]|uniref:hypothetical protein n=1 Tax=Chelatococcus sp. GCM10030263 TaxID=3273387 RepID=UPI00360EF7C0